ncbi:uncharacterized protein ALTATR162_LOCUS11073 [Alternaria atra]|uniref:Uncharacterized protein n=1 Tax=Alternaria atra TaxID=119953 RepID=A0A8J2ICG0_9PLEO|nr:uncharacterized protein ALTATR162_LOCUS11073 [Alternaria atra]CAG5184770.1 unnamed protein product [Alternaria atra]
MADVGAKNSQTETIRKLGSEIRTAMTAIADYEEGVVRLGDTAKDELISTMKKIVRDRKKTLQALEAQYETIAKMPHTEALSEGPRVLVVSIADLGQVASAEAKAWEDYRILKLAYLELSAEYVRMEGEVRDKEHLEEQSRGVGSIESVEATEGDSEVQKLKNNIKDYEDKLREQTSARKKLFNNAYEATIAANRAAKSNLVVPGIGTWTPMPVHIPITTAQVKVKDIPSDVIAASKNIQTGTTSNVAATVPRSMTAIIKVDKTLSSITLCPPQELYVYVKRIEQQKFDIGDIGWFPILRPSLSESSSDLHTEFGYICAKSYPLIIVEKLEDYAGSDHLYIEWKWPKSKTLLYQQPQCPRRRSVVVECCHNA